ncbi:MAG: hypothetical protein K2H64_01580 [Desulfovibrio sp.]|nr:hypothetical protein [Desulfovibrio sp.]
MKNNLIISGKSQDECPEIASSRRSPEASTPRALPRRRFPIRSLKSFIINLEGCDEDGVRGWFRLIWLFTGFYIINRGIT